MTGPQFNKLEITGLLLVALMAILQGIYAIYAFADPAAFALLRGTELHVAGDSDWVKIYSSRTLFVALIIGYLLYLKDYRTLKWAAIFGLAMPVTDAVLAYQALAPMQVILKHVATAVYLLVTFYVLHSLAKR
ncbi:MAG: DUF4267 domain-containing protein [Halieaceae bacterium]